MSFADFSSYIIIRRSRDGLSVCLAGIISVEDGLGHVVINPTIYPSECYHQLSGPTQQLLGQGQCMYVSHNNV